MKINFKSAKTILSVVFAPLLIITTTAVVILYAQGYRIDIFNSKLEKTGVLSIDSNPAHADLYVDNNLIGKTSKPVGALKEGTYEILVTKSGYFDWRKKLPVKAELSTTYNAYLFKNLPEKTTPHYIDAEKIQTINSKNNDHIFIITLNSTVQNTEKKYTVEILDYRINRSFFDFSENPRTVFRITAADPDKLEYTPSYSGEYIIVKDKNTSKQKNYLVKTNQPDLTQLEEINLSDFQDEFTTVWAKDNRHLIMESSNDIYSVDISTNVAVLLTRKSDNLVNNFWQTDDQGFFYYINEDKNNDIPYYKIIQKQLTGANEKTIIDEIFYQQNAEYLTSPMISFIPFTNSPQCTLFCGQMQSFYISKDGTGVVIKTEYALYWYDTGTAKYSIVTTNNADFIEFSPDNTKFIYYNNEKKYFAVYTYKVADNDHLTQPGSKTILDNTEDTIDKTQVSWLLNPLFITYTKGQDIYIIDLDGDNNIKILTPAEDEQSAIFDYAVSNIYTTNLHLLSSDTVTPTATPLSDQTEVQNKYQLEINKYLIH